MESRLPLTGRDSIDDRQWTSWTKLVFDNLFYSSLGPLMDPKEGPRLVVLSHSGIETLVKG